MTKTKLTLPFDRDWIGSLVGCDVAVVDVVDADVDAAAGARTDREFPNCGDESDVDVADETRDENGVIVGSSFPPPILLLHPLRAVRRCR